MKKILPYIIFCILLVYVIIVSTFVATKMGEVTCRGVRVTVNDTVVNPFINSDDVLNIINKEYGEILEKPITSVNKDSVERILAKNPIIESAQVYYSLDGYLHVSIKQREPVLRIMAGESYYIDKNGEVMPLSSKFTSRVVVATGNINKEFASEKLYPFAMDLRSNEFWNSYIEQIVVKANEDIVLIPKVGDFKIVLGKAEGYQERMKKLKVFLEQGIAKKGWNKYKEVNLKFDDQVVCIRK